MNPSAWQKMGSLLKRVDSPWIFQYIFLKETRNVICRPEPKNPCIERGRHFMEKGNKGRSRRDFFRKGIAGLAGAVAIPTILKRDRSFPGRLIQEDKKFIYRTLGNTGIKLPVVSMGVMNADNPNLVKAALDAGIVLLDTAHVYQRGRNEEMIGGVIKDRPRESFVLATKVPGMPRDRRTGLFTEETKAGPFIEKFETSLKRLGLDYVDILYLHSARKKEAVLFEPLMGALQKLKEQGKTRFIGVSTHSNEPEVIQAVTDSKVYDVVLTAYNFRQEHREAMDQALAGANKAGIGVVAMKTQAGVYWDEEDQDPINMKAALKWVLQNPNVHTAIPGFTTFDQMELDLSVMEDLTLTPEDRKDLHLGVIDNRPGLYCDQCNRCVSQCRLSLDIPALMRGYMYAYGYRNMSAARETVREAVASVSPCSECGSCTVHCSKGFDVRQKVTDIARLNQVPEEFLV
jgi:predicted aldo/keto reductase-like oxidoreductase